MKSILSNQRGSVIVLFAALLVCLLGMAGLVVDVGYAYSEKTKMQNGVDAAAIAGAYKLPLSTFDAKTQAGSYLTLNNLSPEYASYQFTNSNRRIGVTYNGSVSTFFMRALGFGSSLPVSAFAAAERQSIFGKYAIFTGEDNTAYNLNFKNKTTVDGIIHSNTGVTLGNKSIVEGVVEYVTNFSGDADHVKTDVVPMPSLPESVQLDLANTYATFTHHGGGWNGSMLVADGDITFDGSGVEGEVCIYSLNGNIKFNGDKVDFHGILYAPNGTITFNGAKVDVTGAIIANRIYAPNKLGVTYNDDFPPEFYKVTLVQ